MNTHNFKLCNLDTDSISFSKQDGLPFSKEEQENLLMEINSHFPDKIRWEHDGIYDAVIVLKTKNYILLQNGIIKKKGSSLKSSKTEKGLSKFMDEVINILLFKEPEELINVYNKYIKIVNRLTSIDDWSSKKTVTKSVLEPSRTTEQNILDAIGDKPVSMGDKVYVYFTPEKKLKLVEHWTGDHDKIKLMHRLYSTLQIFKNVVDLSVFPKYHLKNKKIKESLDILLNET